QLILRSHSLKYPAGLTVAAAGLVLFMSLKDKYAFAIFSAGFTLPFFVQFILGQRGKAALGVTRTLIVLIGLPARACTVGPLRRRRIQWCPWILVPSLLFLCAAVVSMANTTDRTLSLTALEREAEMPLVFLILINVLTEVAPLTHFLRGLYLSFFIEC